jgi:hypothetical protein
MKFGILDTVDDLWMGDDNGPKLFDEEDLAKIAARIVDVRMGHPPGRYRALEFTQTEVRRRDAVDTKMDTLEALTLLEEGKA